MPEERRPILNIATDDDAWAVLEEIAKGRFNPEFYSGIEFSGWSCELMRISHTPVSSSISIPVMRSLLEFQSKINSSYKYTRDGYLSKRRLKASEKEEIEINIVVLPNGSVYNTDGQKALTAILKAAIAKMDSKDVKTVLIASVFIFAVGYFGSDTFKAYVANQQHAADVHEMVQLSEQETARAKIIADLASQSERAHDALIQVESGYQALLKGAIASDGAKILGVNVSKDTAEDLTSNPRRPGEGGKLDGLFEVADMERTAVGVYSVVLKASGQANPITAEVRAMFVPDEQINLLLASLKTGQALSIMMNAWTRGEAVIHAEIARVEAR